MIDGLWGHTGMRTLIYGLLVALGMGVVVAPVVAGLLGAAGLASAPSVRLWLFSAPELICGIAGDDNPGLGALMAGWTVEFIPVGLVVAVLAQARARRSATEHAAAFEQAVTAFHESENDAEYE